MNEQNIDKLFKEKLANYSKTPSADASNKLNDMFAARKRSIGWKFARFAATILLVAVSLYAVHRWSTTGTVDSPEPIAKTIESPAQQLPEINSPIATNEEKATNYSSSTDLESPKVTQPNNESITDSGKTSPIVVNEAPSTAIALNSSEPVKIENKKIAEEHELTIEAETQTLPSEETPTPVRQKVTITYKKSSNPTDPMLALQPEPKQKNNGRLKKIWKNLNPGDISLAGLRTTKDQILVINKRAKDTKSN